MNKRVLIVEDDKAIVEVVKIILEGEGYTIFTTDNADTIHGVIIESDPHLILLDIWLGGHDGGSIAKLLKASSSTAHIPIIMTSANNETEKIAKASGANGFLLKPFTINELLKVIKKYT